MPEFDVLEHGKVQVVDAGTAFGIASQIAELAQCGLRERRSIEPLRDGALIDLRVTNKIRAVRSEGVVEPAEICRGNRDWEPMLPGVDPIHLPAANQSFLCAGRVARDLAGLAERQVVNKAADQPMIDVEVRQPIVAFRIVIVQKALPAVESA